jgi:RNA-directed DNA polymerase
MKESKPFEISKEIVWAAYYGCYFPSELRPLLWRLNQHIVGWAQRKYKRLRYRPDRAWKYLADVAKREPGLFAHWGVMRPVAG